MKNLFLATFAIFAFSTASMAQPATRELKVVMKEMSKDFKAVGQQVSDPSLNQNSADLSHHLGSLILEARAITPPSIESLPAEQRPNAMQGYQQELDLLSAECSKMEAAFRANDNHSAQIAYDKMVDLKGEGHDKFKKN